MRAQLGFGLCNKHPLLCFSLVQRFKLRVELAFLPGQAFGFQRSLVERVAEFKNTGIRFLKLRNLVLSGLFQGLGFSGQLLGLFGFALDRRLGRLLRLLQSANARLSFRELL